MVKNDALIRHMMSAALEAADTYKLVRDYLGRAGGDTPPDPLISVGKAAVAMARAAADHYGPALRSGIVISKLPKESAPVQGLPVNWRYFQGSHPIPDQRSIAATAAVRQRLTEAVQDRSAVAAQKRLVLISGGASALLTAPRIDLDAWQALNSGLLACGCTINEINHVRQHLDAVKGGGLLAWAAPAAMQTLILSDVIGNNIAHIGSGPTVPITWDVAEAESILDRYGVWSRLPEAASAEIRAALRSEPAESGSRGEVASLSNEIIGDIGRSADAAAAAATAAGYQASVIATDLIGEAAEVGARLAQAAAQLAPGACHIYGGETTVTLDGEQAGIGGRNQELALAAALAFDRHAAGRECWLATLATDGEDGPNAGAGGIVHGETVATARAKGLDAADYLARHDSFTFFERLGEGHVRIGSTGTNVNDVTILLREKG